MVALEENRVIKTVIRIHRLGTKNVYTIPVAMLLA